MFQAMVPITTNTVAPSRVNLLNGKLAGVPRKKYLF